MGDRVKIPLWNETLREPARGVPWVSLGTHGCWGMPEILPDPEDRDSYVVTWQRYRDGTDEQVMDVKCSVYCARDQSCTAEACVFDHTRLTSLQAHPCCATWRGRWRVFYCACRKHDPAGKVVEVSAARWSDFANVAVTDDEPAVTPELGFHPHLQFLPLSPSRAWLFYTNHNWQDKLAYSICDEQGRWDQIAHTIPTSSLIGDATFTMGSALKEGSDIVLYASACAGPHGQRTRHDGTAYRFRYSSGHETWTVEQVIVTGIKEPFKRSYGGELFVRVIKQQGRYFLSAQSDRSHRYLAAGHDGVHFEVIADLGARPSWGNAMVGIEEAGEVLLVYAGKDGEELGGQIECLRVGV